MLRFKQHPIVWLWALFAAAIGGAVSAIGAGMGLTMANAAGVRVSVPNWRELVIIMISGAIPNVVLYCKQSPIPTLVDEETTFIKKTTTTTPTDTESEGK